jgi:hypothetical protein
MTRPNNNPRAIIYMNYALSIAKVDDSLHEVVFIGNLKQNNTETHVYLNK